MQNSRNTVSKGIYRSIHMSINFNISTFSSSFLSVISPTFHIAVVNQFDCSGKIHVSAEDA